MDLISGMGTAELSWDEVKGGNLRWRNGFNYLNCYLAANTLNYYFPHSMVICTL